MTQSRREFLKALAKIGAVAALPAGALGAILERPAPVRMVTISANSANSPVLTLTAMDNLYKQIAGAEESPDYFYVSSDVMRKLRDTFEVPERLWDLKFKGIDIIENKHLPPSTYVPGARAISWMRQDAISF